MTMLEKDDIIKGKVLYAVVVEDKKSKLNLEIGFKASEKVLGSSLTDPCETIREIETMTRLYLDDCEDEANENSKIRRGIARDAIEHLTGVRLEDTWKGEKGYQRLIPESVDSVIHLIEGKEGVLFKARDGDKGLLWNLYVPRKKPAVKSLAEIKATMRQRQGS